MVDDRQVLTGATMDVVAREACRAFIDVFGHGTLPLRQELMRLGPNATQKHVDCKLREEDCILPIEQLTTRFLRPMASLLAMHTPKGQAFGLLELPPGNQAGRFSVFNVSVRVVAGMYGEPIFDDDGQVVDYAIPTPRFRIDVITTSEAT